MKESIQNWVKQFLANDNTKLNTGTVFAVVGFVTGWAVVIVYAFILKQDIGTNMANVLMALMGVSGSGFIASMFQKYGGSLNIPPENKQEGQ